MLLIWSGWSNWSNLLQSNSLTGWRIKDYFGQHSWWMIHLSCHIKGAQQRIFFFFLRTHMFLCLKTMWRNSSNLEWVGTYIIKHSNYFKKYIYISFHTHKFCILTFFLVGQKVPWIMQASLIHELVSPYEWIRQVTQFLLQYIYI